MATIEKEIIIDDTPENIEDLFDLIVDYFKVKEWNVVQSRKPEYIHFVKGSTAGTIIRQLSFGLIFKEEAKKNTEIKIKTIGKQALLIVKETMPLEIYTNSDREKFYKACDTMSEVIKNSFK